MCAAWLVDSPPDTPSDPTRARVAGGGQLKKQHGLPSVWPGASGTAERAGAGAHLAPGQPHLVDSAAASPFVITPRSRLSFELLPAARYFIAGSFPLGQGSFLQLAHKSLDRSVAEHYKRGPFSEQHHLCSAPIGTFRVLLGGPWLCWQLKQHHHAGLSWRLFRQQAARWPIGTCIKATTALIPLVAKCCKGVWAEMWLPGKIGRMMAQRWVVAVTF